MKVEYIKEGRFDNAIWIDGLPVLARYSGNFAIANGTALELWSKLSAELAKAGQLGTLDAGIKKLICEQG